VIDFVDKSIELNDLGLTEGGRIIANNLWGFPITVYTYDKGEYIIWLVILNNFRHFKRN
jgi:hypothetical protein